MSEKSFQELVINLLKTTKQVDSALTELKNIAAKINKKYDPRTEFNRWRNSQEGKDWKRKQYQKQGECCAICKKTLQLKGSHIDHKKPLSKYPHLSLDVHNLQITCPDCNISKNKIEQFP